MNLELEEKDREINQLRQAYLLCKERVGKKESSLESIGAEKRMQVEMEKRLEKEREDLGRRLIELEQEKKSLVDRIETINSLLQPWKTKYPSRRVGQGAGMNF
jgi:chromosome segregation ATPase